MQRNHSIEFLRCLLMFMAPLINAGVEGLMEKSPAVAWSAWLSFAVGMTLDWMPHHAFSGCAPVGGTSHSLLTMLFVYVTARMVALAKSPALERRVLHFSIPLALSVVIIGGDNLCPIAAFSSKDVPMT